MFRRPTVFILGAGASWHYGYPTGEELVELVLKRAQQLANLLDHGRPQAIHQPPLLFWPAEPIQSRTTNALSRPWDDGLTQCREIIRRLKDARPLVIDYFLGLNEDLEKLGRFLIAWVILEREYAKADAESMTKKEEPERKKWYRFVISQLVNGCSESANVRDNQVHFVTFNYDTSLDRALHDGLHAHSLFARTDIGEFLRDRVIHLYGRIMAPYGEREELDFPGLRTMRPDDWHRKKALLDLIFNASADIRVIDPKDKDSKTFDAAFELIKAAKIVYILGYGFDESNSARLRLQDALGGPKPNLKSILFTNFGNANRINKKASRLFFSRPEFFLDDTIIDKTSDKYPYFEKSTRNVYDALAFDFDALEDQAS